MSKIVKTLLDDYLEDKSDLNLELLVANVSPSFKLTKKKTEMLRSLILKYEKQKNKTRLDIIVNFLGGVSKPTKTRVTKAKVDDTVEQVDDQVKAIPETMKEVRKLQGEYKELVKQYKEAKGDKYIIESLKPELKAKDQEITTALGVHERWMKANKDPHAQDKFEKAMVQKALGSTDNPDSLASQILKGKAVNFKISSQYNPEMLIKKLFAFNSKEPYPYSAGLIDGPNSIWQVRKGDIGDGFTWNQGTHAL